jgi:hypothetical protein
LPCEFTGTLTFAELSQALHAIVGEEVSVRIELGADARVVAEIVGVLAPPPQSNGPSLVLQIGDSAYLHLSEQEIAHITMVTREGNFYFRIAIELRGATVAIADPELQGLAARA